MKIFSLETQTDPVDPVSIMNDGTVLEKILKITTAMSVKLSILTNKIDELPIKSNNQENLNNLSFVELSNGFPLNSLEELKNLEKELQKEEICKSLVSLERIFYFE